jgi:type IV fimbrial biogenesis protein FimT
MRIILTGSKFCLGGSMQKEKGFTLIELMITITILAIIAMLAAPSFGDMIIQQNMKKSTNELIGVLNQTRARAALERRDIEVQLSRTEVTTLPQNTDTVQYWMPYGSVTLMPISPVSITYGINGGIVGAIGDTNFILCSTPGGISQTISISRMGTVQRVIEGTC